MRFTFRRSHVPSQRVQLERAVPGGYSPSLRPGQLAQDMSGRTHSLPTNERPKQSKSFLQEDCEASIDCSYYSYDYETQFCHQYANCPDQSTEFCPKCISGQPDCGVGKNLGQIVIQMAGKATKMCSCITDQYLMVAGGYDGSFLDDVELVSLREDLPVPQCLQNLKSLPSARRSSAGGPLQPGTNFKAKPNKYLAHY